MNARGKYFELKNNLDTSKNYVYTHSYKNKIFYVGSGNYRRPFIINKHNRTKKYCEFINYNFEDVTVEIEKTFDNKKDALEYERGLTIYYDLYTDNKLVNLNTGNFFSLTDEERNRRSNIRTKVNLEKTLPDETKNNIKEVMSKKNYRKI